MANFDFSYSSITRECLEDNNLVVEEVLSKKLSTLFNQRFLLVYSKETAFEKTIVMQCNGTHDNEITQAIGMFLSLHGINDWYIVKNYIVISHNAYGWARIEALIKNL